MSSGSSLRRIGILMAFVAGFAHASDRSIIVQSTTSTGNSGFYDYLLPMFQEATGIQVNVVAVGTGQAIRNARNCDGDVLLVHAKKAEEAFVAEGYGLPRHDLMYNDFIIVGPQSDPAGVARVSSATEAFRAVFESESLFASRGDDSGTHKKEVALWESASVDPDDASGTWYRETGSGMGATLNAAIAMNAYAITDRASWISFRNKGDFVIQFEGDESLNNQYGVILVNPDKCPSVNAEDARQFSDWLLSDAGQTAIGVFKVDGQQLFFPNAAR